jgi:predicted Zn-dependent protease
MQWNSCGRVAAALLLAVSLAACGEQTLDDVRALQDSGAYADTIDPLRKLLEREPDNAEANYRLGLALIRVGRATAAVFPLKKAAADESMARQAGLLLALTLSQLNNYEEAMAATDFVLKSDPENEAALLARAQAAIGARKAEEALAAAETLVRLQPGDPSYQALLATALMTLGRLDDAEPILVRLEEKPWESDPSGQGRACLILANFFARFRNSPERAAAKIGECLERFPDDLALEPIAAQAYDEIGRRDESLALLRRAFERSPEDAGIRAALAQRLISEGEREEGEQLVAEGARTSGSPQAWLRLTGMRRTQGDAAGALEAIDEALALSPDAPELRFVRADVLIDLGRIDEAEAIVGTIEEETFEQVLRGRLALERGQPVEALAQLDPAIQHWPNNAGARVLAARAAYELGDEARTLSELREATRAEPAETDAALLLARLHLARGDYREASEFAWRHVSARGTGGAAAHLVGARANVELRRWDEARRFLDDLRNKKKGFAGVTLAEEARIAAREKDPEAAIRTLREQKASLGEPEYEDALRLLVDLELAAGRAQEARALVDGLVAKRPDAASLHALRGELLLAAGDSAGAASAFARALELDPRSAAALAGGARIARQEGHAAEAVARFDRAATEAKDDPRYPYEAALTLLATGDTAGARERLERLLREHPEFGLAANDLAWLLASEGRELDRALRLAERAARSDDRAEVLDTLGFVQLRRGDVDAAVASLSKAIERRPSYATAQYHLGLALVQKGDKDGARSALRAALGAGEFPEADQARAELAKLESSAGGAQ